MKRRVLKQVALVCGLALIPAMLVAQGRGRESRAVAVGDRVMIARHTFTGGRGEFVRVHLGDEKNYQVELTGTGLQIEIRALEAGLQPPTVRDELPGVSASETTSYLVRSHARGVYEIRVVGGTAPDGVTLRVWHLPGGARE